MLKKTQPIKEVAIRNSIDLFAVFDKLGITLNPRQQEIVEAVQTERFVCVRATRRGGKTFTSSGILSGLLLNPNFSAALTAPIQKLTEILWQQTVYNLTVSFRLEPTQLSNKDKVLSFPWGSTLLASTLRNRSNVLGRSYDIFIIDEAAIYQPPASEVLESPLQFLTSEIFPTLLEHKGCCLAISTPRSKANWFYDYNQFCEENGRVIKYTIWDVSHIPRDEIHSMHQHYLRLNMERYWKREFEAEFVELDTNVFSFLPKPVHIESPRSLEGEWILSIDPGLNFACVLMCYTPEGVYIFDGFKRKGSTSEHAQAIKELLDQVEPLNMYCDSAAAQTILDLAHNHDLSFNKSQKGIENNITIAHEVSDKLYINTHNEEFYEAFMDEWYNYTYNPETGKPIKKNDHLIDAFLYNLASTKKDFPYIFQEYGLYLI